MNLETAKYIPSYRYKVKGSDTWSLWYKDNKIFKKLENCKLRAEKLKSDIRFENLDLELSYLIIYEERKLF
jgi:hypothetical protein